MSDKVVTVKVTTPDGKERDLKFVAGSEDEVEELNKGVIKELRVSNPLYKFDVVVEDVVNARGYS